MVPAYELPKISITLVAATSFAEKRYTFGTVNSDGQLVTPSAGAAAVGVVQTPGIVGEPCNVMTNGVSFITFGGTVAAGDAIAVGADGVGVKVADAALTIGTCLVGGASGEIGSILLK